VLTQESMQTHNIIDEKQSIQYVHVHIKQRHEIYTHNKKSRRAKKWRATRRPKTSGRQLTLKAKFHYTDPTRTGPDTDKVRAHWRRRAKFHYTDPTRTRPDPHGPARTFLRRNSVGSVRVRVVEFSSYPTTCADFVRVRSVSGPCSGI